MDNQATDMLHELTETTGFTTVDDWELISYTRIGEDGIVEQPDGESEHNAESNSRTDLIRGLEHHIMNGHVRSNQNRASDGENLTGEVSDKNSISSRAGAPDQASFTDYTLNDNNLSTAMLDEDSISNDGDSLPDLTEGESLADSTSSEDGISELYLEPVLAGLRLQVPRIPLQFPRPQQARRPRRITLAASISRSVCRVSFSSDF